MLRLALAQINPVVGDLEGNVELIRDVIEKVEHCDLAVFGEMSLTGYPLEDLVLKPGFIADNKKIRIIKNKKNIGAGKSRNVGLKNSNGNIITFIDSDDTWHPQKLKKQLNFLDKNNYNFIFCAYKKILKTNNLKIDEVIKELKLLLG